MQSSAASRPNFSQLTGNLFFSEVGCSEQQIRQADFLTLLLMKVFGGAADLIFPSILRWTVGRLLLLPA